MDIKREKKIKNTKIKNTSQKLIYMFPSSDSYAINTPFLTKYNEYTKV